jgi:hypothetical protein
MSSPQSGSNSVIQLQLGGGKSSVIVPMVISTLADGHALAWVVVLKTLGPQMFSLLVRRISGLLNCRVLHMPFSRRMTVNAPTLGRIQQLLVDAVDGGAVLVMYPEHIRKPPPKVVLIM